MKCVIIDDEPLAVEIIAEYAKQIPDLEIVAQFHNPVAAINYLQQTPVDLVFLDIEMPNLNGIELVKSLTSPPQFIFTTAYPQFALDGFELNATDYLVKPIPFPRFLRAVQKAQTLYKLQHTENENTFIFVRSDYEDIKLFTSDILYIEGLRDYLKIHLTNNSKPIITLMNFKAILTQLDNPNFVRVHRSFIVNKIHIRAIKKKRILIEDDYIPIGETYKEEVMKTLGM